MALMSGFRRPEDADLFRVVGRHEEFTLYAAVALATVTRRSRAASGSRCSRTSRAGGGPSSTELILRDPQSGGACASSWCAAASASATRWRSPTAAGWTRSSRIRSSTTAAQRGLRDRRGARRGVGSALGPGGLRVRGLGGREPPAPPLRAAAGARRSPHGHGAARLSDRGCEPLRRGLGQGSLRRLRARRERLERVLAACAAYLAR